MTAKSWKFIERMHSTLLKCSGRVGPTGLDLPDSFSDILAVESKSRDVVPGWLTAAAMQSSDNAERLAERQREPLDKRLPITVLHQDKDQYGQDLVIMRLSDFLERVLPALEKAAAERAALRVALQVKP